MKLILLGTILSICVLQAACFNSSAGYGSGPIPMVMDSRSPDSTDPNVIHCNHFQVVSSSGGIVFQGYAQSPNANGQFTLHITTPGITWPSAQFTRIFSNNAADNSVSLVSSNGADITLADFSDMSIDALTVTVAQGSGTFLIPSFVADPNVYASTHTAQLAALHPLRGDPAGSNWAQLAQGLCQ